MCIPLNCANNIKKKNFFLKKQGRTVDSVLKSPAELAERVKFHTWQAAGVRQIVSISVWVLSHKHPGGQLWNPPLLAAQKPAL